MFNFYLAIINLKVSNKDLITSYEGLKTDKFSSEAESIDDCSVKQIEERIVVRSNIDEELMAYQDKLITANSFINKISIISLFYELEYVFNNTFQDCDLELCNKRELNNLNKYYNTLYIAGLPKTITDLLLNQKGRIEAYLLKAL